MATHSSWTEEPGGLVYSVAKSWIWLKCLSMHAWIIVHQSRTWDFLGKNTGGGCHFLPYGIFFTQGLNPSLLHWQGNSLSLSHQGSPFNPYPNQINKRNFLFLIYSCNMFFVGKPETEHLQKIYHYHFGMYLSRFFNLKKWNHTIYAVLRLTFSFNVS